MNINSFRISNIARAIEDGVVAATSSVASGASRAKRAIAVEYQARTVVRLQADIEKQAAKLEAMTPAQRAAYGDDLAEVGERISDLLSKQERAAARKAGKAAAKAAAKRLKLQRELDALRAQARAPL